MSTVSKAERSDALIVHRELLTRIALIGVATVGFFATRTATRISLPSAHGT
jgi:hypothetical protein